MNNFGSAELNQNEEIPLSPCLSWSHPIVADSLALKWLSHLTANPFHGFPELHSVKGNGATNKIGGTGPGAGQQGGALKDGERVITDVRGRPVSLQLAIS